MIGAGIKMNNFNNLERSWRAYGGLACRKDGVLYQGVPYLMKYPANLKSRDLKGVNLSYANDTVNEYLGSHIFSALGMESQETFLGIASDKIVVLCKDFAVDGELIEFNKIKTTSSRDLPDPEDGDSTDGKGSNVKNTLMVIRNSRFFEGLPAEEFFWKMFVIDFLIDNSDRNNGNWGVLRKGNVRTMAPIYDCGNCLESKWDDSKCEKAMQQTDLLEDVVWRRKVSFFTDDSGKRINPLRLIQSEEFPICTMVLQDILSKDYGAVFELINSCEYLSEIKKEFYCSTFELRWKKLQG